MREVRCGLSTVGGNRSRNAGVQESSFFSRIIEQVTGSFADIDVQTRNAVSMVVVEHQASALLVGPVERHGAVAGVSRGPHGQLRCRATRAISGHGRAALRNNHSADEVHVRDVLRADALLEVGDLVCRNGPLMRRSVADPRSIAAVQVERGAVLGIGGAVRSERQRPCKWCRWE